MNNAKLCWVKDAENDLYVNFLDEYGPEYCTVFPTYTLEEILNILPQHTTYTRHYANGLTVYIPFRKTETNKLYKTHKIGDKVMINIHGKTCKIDTVVSMDDLNI